MKRWGARLAQGLPAFYLLAIFFLSAGSLFYQPIAPGDGDLWHHLTAGRFIFAHRALPRDSFFSFLTPPRVYHNHEWLYQALLFAVYSAGGYIGLLVLRTAALGAVLLAIGRSLFGKGWKTPSFYGLLVFTLYALFLPNRYTLVRPCIVSYLLITVFLGILESGGKWLAALPFLALLWGNIQGAEAPVVCLILGSYMAERFFQPRPESPPKDRQCFVVFGALAMAALFLTPLGMGLFDFIWWPGDYVHRFTGEAQVASLSDYFSFNIIGGEPRGDSFFNLLALLAALAAVASAARRKLRLSHLLIMAGGFCLLSYGNLMRFECALLLLPILAANPPFEREAAERLFSKPVFAVLAAALMVLPALALKPTWELRPRWPFSGRGTPQGCISFLRHIDTGGKVWNDPGRGGILEWSLYPRYLLTMDMQINPLFLQEDLYMVQGSFQDAGLLCRALGRYAPDFIMAPLNSQLPGLIGPYPDYALVFFDDEMALYASRRTRPDVVKTYTLAEDPFHPDWRLPDPDPGLRGQPMPKYLSRMLAIDPESMVARWRAAAFYARKGDFKTELAHAGFIVSNRPEDRFGYMVQAHALRHLGRYDEALAALRRVQARSDGPVSDDDILRETAAVHQARGETAEAAHILEELNRGRPPKDWPLKQRQLAGDATNCPAPSESAGACR